MGKDRAGLLPHIIVLGYCIFMTLVALSQEWESWIVLAVWVGVACWVYMFATRGLYDQKAKIVFTLTIWFNMTIYSANASNFINITATITGVAVMVSLLDSLVANYISLYATIFIVLFDLFISKNLNIPNNYAGLEMFMQIVATILMDFVIIILQKNSNRNQKMLQDTMDNLVKAEQGKSDFLANVSHELRTPLNTICGMSDAMLEQPLEDKVREDMYDISAAGRRLVAIVDDILDYTELDNELVSIQAEPYNLTSVLNDLMNMAVALNETKNLEIILDCDARIPSTLIGDSQKIYRVLLNIVDNAIKFTQTGGVIISVKFRRTDLGGNLQFTIRDTGVGMSNDELEMLDAVYNQVDSRRSRQQGGVGLGLAIAKKTVAHMEGFMHIGSEQGEGTTVVISIPQKVGNESPIARVDEDKKVRMLFYMDMNRLSNGVVREAYFTELRNLIESLDIKVNICTVLSECKHLVSQGDIGCVVTAYDDYIQSKDYFDSLAFKCRLGVITDVRRDSTLIAENVAIIQKPIHVFASAAFINGQGTTATYSSAIYNNKHELKLENVSILAVDDVITNLKVTSSLLSKYGISAIDHALSGQEALEKAKVKNYDLIFMDHMMPGMDGVDAMHAIRRLPGASLRHVPIIALTANAVGGARDMLINEGFDDFVSKPIEHGEMERVLKKYLGNFIVTDRVEFPPDAKPLVNELLGAIDEFDSGRVTEAIERFADRELSVRTREYLASIAKHAQNYEFITINNLLEKEGMR